MMTTENKIERLESELKEIEKHYKLGKITTEEIKRMNAIGVELEELRYGEQKRIKREELRAELLAMKVDVEELKQELENAEDKLFDLQMVDRFTEEQRNYDRQLRNTINELNKKIEALTM